MHHPVLRVARNNNATLSIGYGMYYCNGAALVRAEMAVLLKQLHERYPTVAAPEPPVWNDAVGMAIGNPRSDGVPGRPERARDDWRC